MADYLVRMVDSPDDLSDLRDDWDRLHAETSQATFFQTLDWLSVYWQHHGEKQQLRVFFVHDGTRLIGILPLAIYWEKTRIGAARVLGYPLDNWGTLFGPIGPQPGDTLLAALRWIRQQPRDWDVLDLRWANSAIAAVAEAALQQAGLPPIRCASCELRGST